MNCFGEKTSGYGTGRQLSENTYTDVEGVFKSRGVVTFFTRKRFNEIIKSLNYKIIYQEDVLDSRDYIVVVNLITVFKK